MKLRAKDIVASPPGSIFTAFGWVGTFYVGSGWISFHCGEGCCDSDWTFDEFLVAFAEDEFYDFSR